MSRLEKVATPFRFVNMVTFLLMKVALSASAAFTNRFTTYAKSVNNAKMAQNNFLKYVLKV